MNRNSKIPFHNELPWHVPSLDGQTKKWLKIKWNKSCTSRKKGHVKYKLTRTGLIATAAAAANNEMAAKGATNRAKGLMPPPPKIEK